MIKYSLDSTLGYWIIRLNYVTIVKHRGTTRYSLSLHVRSKIYHVIMYLWAKIFRSIED